MINRDDNETYICWYDGSFRPRVGKLLKETEKMVLVESEYYSRADRRNKNEIYCRGTEGECKRVAEKIISAKSECQRRQTDAARWLMEQLKEIKQ